MYRCLRAFCVLAVVMTAMASCAPGLRNGGLSVSVNKDGTVALSSGFQHAPLFSGSSEMAAPVIGGSAVAFQTVSTRKTNVSDAFGDGVRLTVVSESVSEPKLVRTLDLTSYKEFPAVIVVDASFRNDSGSPVEIEGWTACHLDVASSGDDPYFWSFQGQSTEARADWILPIREGFYQKNYMGMNDEDYGGGIPVVCLWRKDAGVIVGHIAPNPELVSLPVEMKEGSTSASVSVLKEFDNPRSIAPGESVATLKCFVGTYEGDCFSPLRRYSGLLERVGVVMPESEPDAFETAWCAWGYGRGFTVDQIVGTLPKVAELGFKWATLDDGYQIAEGDWDVNSNKFPGGDAQMKYLVDMIHNYGLKAELWWCPLAADPGTEFLKKYPESVIIKKDGEPQQVSYWDSYYLSPVDADVLREQAAWVSKFIDEYGFDGLKLDGQHMNAVAPDYNPAHHPDDPEKDVRELPLFYKMIYDTARANKKDAVLQYCPCGDCFSVYNMQYVNKTVSSDPLGSYQIRTKGYVLRAIAPKTAYYGDHIELSDGGNDFPTQLGIGAVLGTKFTWPVDEAANRPQTGFRPRRSNFLSPEKEALLKNALEIYNSKMLSTGEYVPGLYDIGYDYPETHVIAKDGNMYYAFYAHRGDDQTFNSVELRGLRKGHTYKVTDYYNHVDLGEITVSDTAVLEHPFQKYLLLEVSLVR